MKVFLALGVIKLVLKKLIFIKSFSKFDFLDLVKSDFLNLVKFTTFSIFSILPPIVSLLILLGTS